MGRDMTVAVAALLALSPAVSAQTIEEYFVATGPSEVLAAPAATFGGVTTTATYAGLLDLKVSGTVARVPGYVDDAFYSADEWTLPGTVWENWNLAYSFTGCASDVECDGAWIRELVVFIEGVGEVSGESPPYDPDHDYRVVIDAGGEPVYLTLGTPDGGTWDNTGEFQIELTPVERITATYELAVSSAAVAQCAPAQVFAALTNAAPVQGFSFGVAHDPAVARLAAIDYAGCVALEALNDGTGPSYFEADLDAGTAGCEGAAAGGTVYCIASESEPATDVIPAGADQAIARLTYEVAPGAAADSASPLDIVDCLGDVRPWPIELTVDYLPVAPALQAGTLNVGPSVCRFTRGDPNHDGAVGLSDAVCVLGYLFGGGCGPLRCLDAADANDDGALDIGDAVVILDYVFGDGVLAPPGPACGVDPSGDGLVCPESVCGG